MSMPNTTENQSFLCIVQISARMLLSCSLPVFQQGTETPERVVGH